MGEFPVRRRLIFGSMAIGLFALYVIALIYAIGVVAAWRVPKWWAEPFSTRHASALSWLFISHMAVILVVSLAFAWVIARVFGPLSLWVSVIFGLATWVVFEAPPMFSAFSSGIFLPMGFWIADTIQLIGSLPVLVWLFQRPAGAVKEVIERSRGWDK